MLMRRNIGNSRQKLESNLHAQLFIVVQTGKGYKEMSMLALKKQCVLR
jgi:hypothetical protein